MRTNLGALPPSSRPWTGGGSRSHPERVVVSQVVASRTHRGTAVGFEFQE